jgi:hypothetical protein
MDTTLWYSATSVGITPSTPLPLAGYLARGDQLSTGTHDPLTASLLWLGEQSGRSSVCWVGLDALSVDTDIASRIKETVGARIGIDPDAVLVCCSHTHSGPQPWTGRSMVASSVSSTVDDTVVDRLLHDIGRGAAGLPALRSPVVAGWSVVDPVGLGSNRYRTTGPHETSTGVLTLCDRDRTVLAVLFDYACHPTVLGPTNLRYSADFPAAARRVVAAGLRATDGVETPPVSVFLQGAAGDASTRFTRREQTFNEVNRLGGILGGAVLRGVLDGAADPVHGALPRVRRSTVRLPTRALPDEAAARAGAATAEAAWQSEHDRGQGTPAERIARTRYEGALLLAGLSAAGLPAEVELPVTTVALGEVVWVHLPVELFASLAGRIRAASPFGVTRIVGYTDGYFGYVADEDAHRDGYYEALSSLFDPAGGERLLAAVIELITAA